MANKRSPGQPTKYREEFHPENFIALSEQGKTFAQIAKAWKVDRDTIKEWIKVHTEFSAAVKKGREVCEAWYMDLGQLAMLGQATMNGQKINVNLGFYVWMTKNMFKWSDKVVVQDKPDMMAKRLTPKELAELRKVIQTARGSK
jgi:hypothetical protein